MIRIKKSYLILKTQEELDVRRKSTNHRNPKQYSRALRWLVVKYHKVGLQMNFLLLSSFFIYIYLEKTSINKIKYLYISFSNFFSIPFFFC